MSMFSPTYGILYPRRYTQQHAPFFVFLTLILPFLCIPRPPRDYVNWRGHAWVPIVLSTHFAKHYHQSEWRKSTQNEEMPIRGGVGHNGAENGMCEKGLGRRKRILPDFYDFFLFNALNFCTSWNSILHWMTRRSCQNCTRVFDGLLAFPWYDMFTRSQRRAIKRQKFRN